MAIPIHPEDSQQRLPGLSKDLARKCGLYVTSLRAGTLHTVGLHDLDDRARDLLYHLHPDCQHIQHSIKEGRLFWTSFYQHYCQSPSKKSFTTTVTHSAKSFLEDILETAIGEGFTDIHFTPHPQGTTLRYRRDGLLLDAQDIPHPLSMRCINRLKILGAMNIAQQHTPQDGRFTRSILGRKIDCRLSTHPTIWGEKIVVRLLDSQRAFVPLEQLGFQEDIRKTIQHLLEQPAGLFVVTGPTGAGKTTTLYALLQRLNRPDVNIVTLESPVEYQLPGITQTEAERRGINYTQGLRSLLRQDPDIILIGEIRDEETAQMAIRAAMTGHKVLTTFHTEDVFGVIPRLLDLKIDRQLIADHLLGILSQRLLRQLCLYCQGDGCTSCHHTGFLNRLAIGEVLALTPHLKQRIAQDKNLDLLRANAQKEGYTPLKEAAEKLIHDGLTTTEEVQRVLGTGSPRKGHSALIPAIDSPSIAAPPEY